MGRKRRKPFYGTKKCDLRDAMPTLSRLQVNVTAATVAVTFTVEDVMRAVLPDEIVDHLKKAYSMCPPPWRDTLAYQVPITNGTCSVQVSVKNLMLLPRDELMKLQPDRFLKLVPTLEQLHTIRRRFQQVEQVISYLQENATIGAVRYYWPTVISLLPADHEIHRVDGQRYQEPPNVAQWVPRFRETSATVASALLCPAAEPIHHAKIWVDGLAVA